MDKKKLEKLYVSAITDITEAVDKTDDAFLKLTLANIAAKIGLIYVKTLRNQLNFVEFQLKYKRLWNE